MLLKKQQIIFIFYIYMSINNLGSNNYYYMMKKHLLYNVHEKGIVNIILKYYITYNYDLFLYKLKRLRKHNIKKK